jgi:hypothetical protein
MRWSSLRPSGELYLLRSSQELELGCVQAFAQLFRQFVYIAGERIW